MSVLGFVITEHPVGFQLAPDIWIKKKKKEKRKKK